MKDKQKDAESKPRLDLLGFFSSPSFVITIVACYVILIFLLLLAELKIEFFAPFRATDKVLMLFALLFMPFFILATPKLVNTLTLRFGADRELQVKLNQINEEIDSAVVGVETKVAQQVSSAEQALWPMLAGDNPFASARLEGAQPQLIIGSKQDLSHVFFANFLKLWLEKRVPGLECLLRLPNGGSLKNFADVKHRWIDLYIDFTGTCCQYFNIDHRHKSDTEIITQLNAYCQTIGMKFMSPLGATENYCLVIRRDLAAELGVDSISRLALAAEGLTFSADPEYLNRRDCWLGLQQMYGIRFAAIEPCKVTDRYALLPGNEAQVFVGYETDPEIRQHNLLVLEDDEQFFPTYEATPLVSQAALDQIAGLEQALQDLQQAFKTEDLVHAVHKLRVSNASKDAVDSLCNSHYRRIVGL